MLAGRERTVSALGVWLANTNPILGLFRALRVHPGNIPFLLIHLRVGTVPLVQYLQLAASQKAPVNVTLGIREKVEQHARSAVSTSTRQDWGLLIALIVYQILSLCLAASQNSHVNVTLGSQEKMEAHALCAISTNTKMSSGRVLALIVHQTPPLQLAASQKAPVNVTLGIQERMEAHAHSAVSTNTNKV